MRLVIASTAGKDSVSLEALNAMRQEAFGKTLFYEGKLWVVDDAETVPVVLMDDDADRNKTYILIIDLKGAVDASDTAVADCELCGRTSQLRPDQVALCGVPLNVCLYDAEFTRALVALMKHRGIDVDPWASLQGTVKPEERKEQS